MQSVQIEKFEFVDPVFFTLPLKKIAVETDAIINRVHFISRDRVVAVAKIKGDAN